MGFYDNNGIYWSLFRDERTEEQKAESQKLLIKLLVETNRDELLSTEEEHDHPEVLD